MTKTFQGTCYHVFRGSYVQGIRILTKCPGFCFIFSYLWYVLCWAMSTQHPTKLHISHQTFFHFSGLFTNLNSWSEILEFMTIKLYFWNFGFLKIYPIFLCWIAGVRASFVSPTNSLEPWNIRTVFVLILGGLGAGKRSFNKCWVYFGDNFDIKNLKYLTLNFFKWFSSWSLKINS